MKEAIKKAIEGGYVIIPDVKIELSYIKNKIAYFSGGLEGSIHIFLNDPFFWKSLGKALGWKKEVCMYDGGLFNGHKDADTPNGPGEWYSNCEKCGAEQLDKSEFPEGNSVPEWQYRWHRFIDHLAEGKDIESFFSSLLI